MTGTSLTLFLLVAYGCLVALIAHRAEKTRWSQGAAWRAPVIYALGMCAYCTSWTFYGSVGGAAKGSWTFLTIYLGPTLCALFWGDILRRLIRIKERFQVSSLADLLSVRYGKCPKIAAWVTLITMIALIPYLALQVRALRDSFSIISEGERGMVGPGIDAVLFLLLVTFSAVFGARNLKTTKGNEGLITAIAFESIVKLVAFLAVGIFCTFIAFDGVGPVLERARETLDDPGAPGPTLVSWITLTLLSGFAFLFLPRQFHVAVVEAREERHVWTARRLVPLYLLLINLFVVPIAAAGLAMGMPASAADSFVIAIPAAAGHDGLAYLVFFGGVSAALGMITLSSVTLALMVCNHLVLPTLTRLGAPASLQRQVLFLRRATIAGMIALGYAFALGLGNTKGLVSLGIMAFAAIAQFAPATLGAIYWSGAHRRGAMAGIIGGFAIWTYTLLLPTLSQGGILPDAWLTHGPLGIESLRPLSLFGLEGLDMVSHAMLWSLGLNVTLFVLCSQNVRQQAHEREEAVAFTGILGSDDSESVEVVEAKRDVPLEDKREVVEVALGRWLTAEDADKVLARGIRNAGLSDEDRISVLELNAFQRELERELAAIIGVALAHQTLANSGLVTDEERQRLSSVYADMMAAMQVSPLELQARLVEFRERETRLMLEAEDLETQVQERTEQLQAVNQELLAAKAQAEAASDAKSDFLCNMSHEVRTPMTAILGSADLALLDDSDTQEMARHLRTIQTNGEHLLAVVSDILDISKIEAGRLEVETVPTDVRLILQEVATLQRPIIEDKGLQFGMQIDSGVPQLLPCDPTRLRQILLNLLNNATKFTERGAVHVIVQREFEDQTYVRFDVRDTGIGIDAETLGQLFRPFKQADGSTTRKFGGTGLGLAISRQLARLLGGDLDVSSVPGQGSNFRLRLPARSLALEQAPESQSKVEDLDDRTVEPSEHRLLVVEDNKVNQRIATSMLEREGYHVDVAENGREGMNAALAAREEGRPYSVVLMDMMMPVMDGYEATRALREAHYEQPIVALTAHAMESERKRCHEVGCDDFATKPYRREHLLRTIERQILSATPSP